MNHLRKAAGDEAVTELRKVLQNANVTIIGSPVVIKVTAALFDPDLKVND